jgi:aconitate hydratase
MDQSIINKKTLTSSGKEYAYYDIPSLEALGWNVTRLPYSLKILLECAVRNYDGKLVTMEHIKRIAAWPGKGTNDEIPFIPSRIILQDFTGVPVVVDLAAMRAKMHEMGGDAGKVNPIVPVDLVIDHSVNIDSFCPGPGKPPYHIRPLCPCCLCPKACGLPGRLVLRRDL